MEGLCCEISTEQVPAMHHHHHIGRGYLTRADFAIAAQQYAHLSNQLPSGVREGAQAYAQGWRWEDGINAPFSQHLQRTFLLLSSPTPQSSASAGRDKPNIENAGDDKHNDTALLNSMAVEDDMDVSSVKTGDAQTTMPADHKRVVLRVHQTIAYSATWKVPVLYVEASREDDGTPFSLEALCESDLLIGCSSGCSSIATLALPSFREADAAFPTISLGENPGTGGICAYLHPCHTADSIATTLLHECFDGEPLPSTVVARDTLLKYMQAFVMLCSTVVEMRATFSSVVR